jgi:hypothetical protein
MLHLPSGKGDALYSCVELELICSNGVLLTFCLGWPQTVILLLSASQVVGIIDMHHHTQHFIFLFLTLSIILHAMYFTFLPGLSSVFPVEYKIYEGRVLSFVQSTLHHLPQSMAELTSSQMKGTS